MTLDRLQSLASIRERGGLVYHDWFDDRGRGYREPIEDDSVDVSCVIFYRGRMGGKHVRKIRDDDLQNLLSFPTIKELILDDSMVTDRGLQTISQLRNLERLTLFRTRVTDGGVQELRQALPECRIER